MRNAVNSEEVQKKTTKEPRLGGNTIFTPEMETELVDIMQKMALNYSRVAVQAK